MRQRCWRLLRSLAACSTTLMWPQPSTGTIMCCVTSSCSYRTGSYWQHQLLINSLSPGVLLCVCRREYCQTSNAKVALQWLCSVSGSLCHVHHRRLCVRCPPRLAKHAGPHAANIATQPAFRELLALVTAHLPSFQPQHLANVLWAHATLGSPPPEGQLARICAAALRKLPRFTSQNLANLMWALAKMGCRPGEELLEVSAMLSSHRPCLRLFESVSSCPKLT